MKPPLAAILTPRLIASIEKIRPHCDTTGKRIDQRLLRYVEIVNTSCGHGEPPRAYRNQYNQVWMPDPRRTYSVAEIADYLAAAGVRRFALKHFPRGVDP